MAPARRAAAGARQDWLESLRRLARRSIPYGLVAAVLAMGCPAVLAPPGWPSGLPVQNLGALIAVAVALVAVLAGWPRRLRPAPPFLVVALAALVLYVSAVGLVHSGRPTFRGHFFFREAVWLGTGLAAALTAFLMRRRPLVRTLRGLCLGSSAALLVLTVPLRLDLLSQPHVVSGRRIELALYALSTAAVVTMPVIARMAGREVKDARRLLVLAAVAVLVFAMVSGTRSLFVVLLFSGALSASFLLRRRSLKPRFAAGAALVGVLGIVLLWRAGELGVLARQLGQTEDLVENVRWVEVREFLGFWQDWFPWGAGIGVGFPTAVGLEANEVDSLVNAPHIGILAWTVKAGLLGLLFTGLLLLEAGRGVLAPRRDLARTIDTRPGLAVLAVIGCTSGGWTMIDLFLTGLLVAAGTRRALPAGPAATRRRRRPRPDRARTLSSRPAAVGELALPGGSRGAE